MEFAEQGRKRAARVQVEIVVEAIKNWPASRRGRQVVTDKIRELE